MITEEEAKRWWEETLNDCNEVNSESSFIAVGKRIGLITKSHLEEAREAVKYWREHSKVYVTTGEIIYDSSVVSNPHILLIQDLNRIVAHYESAIKELPLDFRADDPDFS